VPGDRTAKQVLAANIDFALVVQGLDRDFNVRRLERYLVQIAACGIAPVIILNKADLVTAREQYAFDISALQWNCPVYFCSTLSGEGLEILVAQVLQPYRTYVLVGSSGAGKSSLLNALMHAEIQKTGGTSDSTNKGKHTTTTRELFRLPNGSLVIDNPGMREFGLTDAEGNETHDLFPVIHALSVNCRFTDCNHVHNTGCAVKAALEAGTLDPGIYESYLKLAKEQHRFSIAAEDKKRQEKQFGKLRREACDHRRKYKF
jgi:ribosome biogenesis GTPase